MQDAHILEIGAGYGNTTVSLAEAGANVDAVELVEANADCAALRLDLHGLSYRARFHVANADDLPHALRAQRFDAIGMFACLEHMTFSERVTSLRNLWRLLPPGKLLIVCDTPNRLWYYDDHTALQNFFHWLRDDVARLCRAYGP